MRSVILSILLATSASFAYADVIARYAMGPETLVLSYRDDQHIRVDRGQMAYSIINGDQATAIISQGGAQIVMNVDDMGDVIASAQQGQSISIPDTHAVSLKPTKEFSNIAGFKGRLYIASDGANSYRTVLTDSPAVIEASDALRQFFRRFAGAMKNDRGNKLLALENSFKDQTERGVLYVEGGFKLLSISQEPRSSGHYTPPPIGIQFNMPAASR
ncbi:hypothetical protein [Zhongshania aliphaticivorans]|uniref:hypothetical protein n=1 Tax=Zhongshania aliphaticivorans TaxID=1470434 RepID=UPI0039C9E220